MHGNEGNANQELVSGQALQRTSRSQAGQLKVLLWWRSGGAQKPAREAKNKEGTLNKLKGRYVSHKRNTKMRFPPPDLFLMTGKDE